MVPRSQTRYLTLVISCKTPDFEKKSRPVDKAVCCAGGCTVVGAREKKHIDCSKADVPVLLWLPDCPSASLDSSAAGDEGSRSLSRLSCALRHRLAKGS